MQCHGAVILGSDMRKSPDHFSQWQTAVAKLRQTPAFSRSNQVSEHCHTVSAILNDHVCYPCCDIRQNVRRPGHTFAHQTTNIRRHHGACSAAPFSASQLPEAFVRADFEFYKRVLDGQQDDKPRWKKMLGLLDWAVGEALGELYVQQVTSPSPSPVAVRPFVSEGNRFREFARQVFP